jgi:hypothetical protein
VGEPVADRALTVPHQDRLSPTDPEYEEILSIHKRALDRGAMSYIDPRSGFSVLTAGYLKARGSCCASGCRHCPYLM